jgi:hypothetical protein
MTIVHESAWYRLTSVARGAYRLERTSQTFADLKEMDRVLVELLDILERQRPRALLIDLRSAPARNDPEFESKFAEHRVRMSQAAKESALLVRTQAGKLQVGRLARTDRVDLVLFEDERRALEWLRTRAE